MKKQVGFVREMFQQVFSGLAYEHSGEMLSSSRKDQVLSDALTSTTVNDNDSVTSNVVFAVTSQHQALTEDCTETKRAA
ncbi:MAG: hypothetical protein KAT25_00260 [Sulfuriflexus sp.]|nr:hypothetical protein [Sulfuriflexus sp.]